MAPSARRGGTVAAAAAANSPRRSARLAVQRSLPTPPAVVVAPAPRTTTTRRRRLPLPFRRSDNLACLVDEVARQQVVFVHAWPGTGRSSQIPRALHAAGHGRVVCSQLYRIAAESGAVRAAADTRAGEVSCRLAAHGDDPAASAITYTTHQLLLHEIAADPLLSRYGAAVVDEADDGTLLTSAVLSCVKAAAAHRPDFRVVICTRGTLFHGEEETVHAFFPGAVHLWFDAKLALWYPKEFLPEPVTDYVAEAVRTVCRIHSTEPPGDVLVFLPSHADIEAVELLLIARAVPGLVTRCLHDGLPINLLIDGVLCPAPDGERKVVLATDVADSAVFVEGISYIVDSGFRCADNEPPSLTGDPPQRLFRALKAAVLSEYHIKRRENRGKCFCLYTSDERSEMFRTGSSPLRTRTDDVDSLAGILLLLKDLGIIRGNNIDSFDFVLPPRQETQRRAMEMLEAAGAVGLDGEVTEQGRRMSRQILGTCYF